MPKLSFFKDLDASNKIIDISKLIIERQKIEYSADTQLYFANMATTGLPFPQDFSTDPEQIQQVKNLHNGLHELMEVFKTCEEATDKWLATAYNFKATLSKANQACVLLTQVGADVMSTFQSEMGDISKLFTMIQLFLAGESSHMLIPANYSSALGAISGQLVEQMNPATASIDYDSIGYITSMLPKMIDTMRTEIDRYVPNMKVYASTANQQKIENIFVKRGQDFADKLRSSRSRLSLLWNLMNSMEHIRELSQEITQEVGHLDAGVELRVLELVAKLKYELIPELFAFVDKIEIQLMLKPGRLSDSIMPHIKSLYVTIIHATRANVDYTSHQGKLLYLEDKSFLDCRLKPRLLEINSAKVQAEAARELAAASHRTIADQEYLIRSLKQEITVIQKGYYTYMVGIVSWDSQEVPPLKSQIKTAEVNIEASRAVLLKAQQRLNDQQFKMKLLEDIITSVQKKAHISLLPHTKTANLFEISDQDVLSERHLLRIELIMTSAGNITAPEQLTRTEAGDLAQAYRERLYEIEQAETATDALITSDRTFDWVKPNFALEQAGRPLLPDTVYVKPTNGYLHYNLRIKSSSGCNLYSMSLNDALVAKHSGCYVWNRPNNQLSYIAPDGIVQDNITLTTYDPLKQGLMILTLRKKATSNVRFVQRDFIETMITEQSGHFPCQVCAGSIPVKQLKLPSNVKSLQDMQPALQLVTEEIFDRGLGDNDGLRADFQSRYATIQPYLFSAVDDLERVQTFDHAVVHSNIDERAFKEYLISFKAAMSVKKEQMQDKLDTYTLAATNNPTPGEALFDDSLIPIAGRFSQDVAEFMSSPAAIQHTIDKSQKILFKIDLALLQEPAPENVRHLHKLKIQHLSQQSYHQKLLRGFTSHQPQAQPNFEEHQALLYASPKYTPCFLTEFKPLAKGQLQLLTVDLNLEYAMSYYGEELKGTISIRDIYPHLQCDGANTRLDARTLASIMQNIYQQRQTAIIESPEVLLADEALDLYQWYLNQALIHPSLQVKLEHYKTYATNLVTYDEQLEPSNGHSINGFSEALSALKQLLTDYTRCLNPALRGQYASPQTHGVPYPTLENADTALTEPAQVLQYKRLINLVYYCEQIILELGNPRGNQFTPQILQDSYNLYDWAKKASTLCDGLLNDLSPNRIYSDILAQAKSVIDGLTQQVDHFASGRLIMQQDDPELMPGISMVIDALYRLPQLIDPSADERNVSQKAYNTALKIHHVLNTLNSGHYFQLLFFKSRVIGGLMTELQKRVLTLSSVTHTSIVSYLARVQTDVIAKMIFEADSWEDQYGLEPGLISVPVKKICDELYLGFIEQLVPSLDSRVCLMQNPQLLLDRIDKARDKQISSEVKKNIAHDATSFLDKLLATYQSSKVWFYGDTFSHTELHGQLRVQYQPALPYLQTAIRDSGTALSFHQSKHKDNGCNVYFMTPDMARAAEHNDCLVWFWAEGIEPKLVYLTWHSPDEQINIRPDKRYKFMQLVELKNGKYGPNARDGAADNIVISSAEIESYITNLSSKPKQSKLPFGLTPDNIRDLDELRNPHDIERFHNKITSLLPTIKTIRAYWHGRYNTSNLALDTAQTQIDFLAQEQMNYAQTAISCQAQIHARAYQDQVEKFCNNASPKWRALGYDKELSDSLKAMPITTDLAAKKKIFDAENGGSFDQLLKIRQALDDFNAYLTQAKQSQALFENEQTIQVKESIVNDLDILLHDKQKNAQERLAAIQTYLSAENGVNIAGLLTCNIYQADLWSIIKHFVVECLVACNLYTPKFIRHIEDICCVAASAADSTKQRQEVHSRGLFKLNASRTLASESVPTFLMSAPT